ncbi:MAG: 4Fe-4S dicluster domain-containing protein [Candidatus Bathyarchaeota archaeon]|nr:4Fe-4S dicluster domain-containing protein [Candidatus Bathyarchaeota archaeon]
MKRITVTAENCAGCRQCEMVCSFQHTGKFSSSLARVTVHKDDRNGLDYPLMCRQCTDCPPLDSCPVQAISRNSDGAIWVDWQTCTGCGLCENVCKYDAVKLNESKAYICDLCGGDPHCVQRCPTEALQYIETPEFTETPETAFSRMKEEWCFNE